MSSSTYNSNDSSLNLSQSGQGIKGQTLSNQMKKDSLHDQNIQTPYDILQSCSIDHTTDYLILGDSCISKLNPHKMNTGTYQYIQKVCVSGVQTADIINWLDTQQIHQTIKKLVVHVGVNDSGNGVIGEQIWSNMLSKLHVIFPNAHITMSSIIPTRTLQQTNVNITKSNVYLQQSCKLFRSVAFVDHTYAFRTQNNAPKQVLYDNFNQKHPSMKGVLVLAKNIKWHGIDLNKLNAPNRYSFNDVKYPPLSSPNMQQQNYGNSLMQQQQNPLNHIGINHQQISEYSSYHPNDSSFQDKHKAFNQQRPNSTTNIKPTFNNGDYQRSALSPEDICKKSEIVSKLNQLLQLLT